LHQNVILIMLTV